MIVVSDTSPLNYLLLIQAEQLLAALFNEVYIPQAVADELRTAGAPQAVREWMSRPPPWLTIRAPAYVDLKIRLDAGETHAICLAEELKADHLLMDEWAGRDVAQRRGLHVVGTVGVLDQAAERNLIVLRDVVDRLMKTSFRVAPSMLQRLLDADAARRRASGH